MDSFDKMMNDIELKREKEEQLFLEKCLKKVSDDPKLIYKSLAYVICKRYNLSVKYPPSIVYLILDYYVENVDEPFMDWLHKDNAPFVRRLEDVKKIFHEFTCITSDEREIVDLANRFYNLNLEVDYDYGGYEHYVYAYEFDFNTFTPLNIGEVKDLLNEIQILQKYDVDTSELEEKLSKYEFTDEELQLISGG